MVELAKLAESARALPGVKAVVAASTDGSLVTAIDAGDAAEAVASCLTLMLMHAASVEAALGCRKLVALRLSAKGREDLILLRHEAGGLGVVKTAGASGTALAAKLKVLANGQNDKVGE